MLIDAFRLVVECVLRASGGENGEKEGMICRTRFGRFVVGRSRDLKIITRGGVNEFICFEIQKSENVFGRYLFVG